VSESGAWNDWLEYFLIGAARTSQDALSRASRINVILAQWQREVAGESTNTPLRIVDLLAANPFITATGIAGELGVAFTTAQRAIGRLCRYSLTCRNVLNGDPNYSLTCCRAALNSRNCLQDDELLQLNPGILDSQCT
jgi:hypothetical protein